MRLQFWRDTITRTLLGSPPKEPIAILLGAAVADLDARGSNSSSGSSRSSNLNSKRNWFLRIINAREQSLTNTSFSNLQALESYAENTYSTLLYLTLSALPVNSITADHVASHIGKAAGISTVLRGVPLVAFPSSPSSSGISATSSLPSPLPKQGTIAIPLDVMAQCGVREEDVFRYGAHAPGLRDAVFTVATRASDHLITARQMIKNLRMGQDVGHSFEHEAEEEHQHNNLQRGHHDQYQSARQNRQEPPSPSSSSSSSAISKQLNEVERSFGVFMPAIVTQLWLNQLQRADFDVFDKGLLRSDWRLPWRAYFAYRQKEF
jgi:NADH dehydrogenase [ubiquinone] 1 alpha subcomplex assembly factor 6